MGVVTLLTDFGTVDGYVGAMKGVIASIAPPVPIVDLTHDIPAQDVRAGAWALRQAARAFPPASIHVGVVDPGVGSARRALLLRAEDRLYLAPDNGLASWVTGAEAATVWSLDRPELFCDPVSATFHGRDVFASVAGHLAAGRAPESCGTPVDDWQRLPWPSVEQSGPEVVGQVVHVDRFGNLVTNIEAGMLCGAAGWQVSLPPRGIGPLRTTYADVEEGAWVAYVGGAGMVEIAVRNGNAAALAGSAVAQKVRLWHAR
jgi:S-adenosylmethionine hydrolase